MYHANAAHLPVNGTILREKANQLALQLSHAELNAYYNKGVPLMYHVFWPILWLLRHFG